MATFYNATTSGILPGHALPPQLAQLWSHELGWLSGALPPVTPVDQQFELTPRTGAALVLAFVCGLLANAAGVGGGPFYIPLFNVLLGFNLKVSAALSHTVVSASALASTLYGLRQTSPRDPNRPLLDVDLALTFIPALLLGVSFGVLFNVLIPEWLQTILLVLLLAFVIRNTARKARKQWAAEKAARTKDASAVAPLAAAREPLLPAHESHDVESAPPPKDEHADAAAGLARKGTLLQLLEMEDHPGGVFHEEAFFPHDKTHGAAAPEPPTRQREQPRGMLARIPFGKLAEIVVLWLLFLYSQQLKSRYGRCTWQYLSILAGQAAVLVSFAAGQIWYQVRKAATRPHDLDPELRVILAADAEREPGKPHPARALAQVAGVMALAGMTAGLLGIGGALLFNPWLLQLGVHPQVTASTAVLMILFSSSAIALSLSFQGLLSHSYALVFAPVCFAASLVGVTLIGRVVRQSGRASIIVIILTVVITAGTVVTGVFGGIRSYEQIVNGGDIGFHPICTR
ncbi:hypothetical protein KFL_006220070 [Klebsormidium nitens]|uniref:Sulfite exporter TauE/SafE family protein n=1 Tax=Klebsormidium nitens TaxID=105231 RepID=A0A1Y1IQ75_KLENI|nr:hypothetical protein KFL_006220070 [Klebsormidium nitens]|eukprot:GAQ90288.1 hypothetical protein KFL_006220070 [Klebsormidium nitens]